LVAGEVVQVMHRDRVLVPVDVELGQRGCDLQRRRQLPQAVVLDHDIDPIADRAPDRLDQGDRAPQILEGDVAAARGQGMAVERPDLHRGDAVLQQRLCELGRTPMLGVQIVEGVVFARVRAREQ
jgi:hypothetical protein